jgi:DnaK suppressor protein
MRNRPVIDDEATPMTAEELAETRHRLQHKRSLVLSESQRAPEQRGEERRADENDRASDEVEELFARRLQERARALLKKLDNAIARIDNDEYDECAVCGEVISSARLMARPETTMCVLCKEEEERLERQYLKPRLRREDAELF